MGLWPPSQNGSDNNQVRIGLGHQTCALGGRVHRRPKKLGEGGLGKGVPKENLSMMVYVKRVMHACPPHVAKMIQRMVLTRVYALSSKYVVTLVT